MMAPSLFTVPKNEELAFFELVFHPCDTIPDTNSLKEKGIGSWFQKFHCSSYRSHWKRKKQLKGVTQTKSRTEIQAPLKSTLRLIHYWVQIAKAFPLVQLAWVVNNIFTFDFKSPLMSSISSQSNTARTTSEYLDASNHRPQGSSLLFHIRPRHRQLRRDLWEENTLS